MAQGSPRIYCGLGLIANADAEAFFGFDEFLEFVQAGTKRTSQSGTGYGDDNSSFCQLNAWRLAEVRIYELFYDPNLRGFTKLATAENV